MTVLDKHIIIFLLFLFPVVESEIEDPFSVVFNNNPLVAYQKLVGANDCGGFKEQESYYYQALATLYSFTGRYIEAKSFFAKHDSIRKQSRVVRLEKIVDSHMLNPDTTILQLAKHFNVIAFNEEHHVPLNRAIVYYYLGRLAQIGYKYLALEALNNYEYQDKQLQERGYPKYKNTTYFSRGDYTGLYINEPIFGNLVRYALKMGYILIPYDSSDDHREKIQAANIVAQYHQEEGKLVILGGYGHIRETRQDSLMGSFLKEALKEDILTVKLTGATDYPAQLDTSFIQPVLLAGKEDFGYDYQYLVPPVYKTQVSYNIPRWYVEYLRFPILEIDLSKEFPEDFTSFSTPYLIRLTKASEKDGVPVYQYLETVEKRKKILLPFPEQEVYALTILVGKREFVKTIRR